MNNSLAISGVLTSLGFIAWAAFGSHSNTTIALFAAGFALGAWVDFYRSFK